MALPVISLGLKSAIIIVATTSLHLVLTPPKPVDVSKSQRYNADDKGERFILAAAVGGKAFAWIAAATELYLSWYLPQSSVLTVWTFLGGALTVGGTIVRLRCYKLLGDRFTFELATHSSMRQSADDAGNSSKVQSSLVTTGPYAFVRHPSYIAGCTAFYGVCILFVAPGSALTSFQSRSLLITCVRTAMIGLALSLFVTIPRRVRKEEDMLQVEFGEEWERYARNVRWAVIPGIF